MADGTVLKDRLQESISIAGSLDRGKALRFVKEVWNLKPFNKLIFVGNGASNTIANHAALDYMSQMGKQTVSVNDPAVLTAFSNDFGYENVFERYIKINYRKGDILVCVSSSGNSENVIRAASYVMGEGGFVVAFTGFDKDNKLSKIATMNFWVDSKNYNVVESVHNLWLAVICDVLTDRMGDKVGVHGLNV